MKKIPSISKMNCKIVGQHTVMNHWVRACMLTIIVMVQMNTVQAESIVTVSNLRCDHRFDPIGIESSQPMLSWQLDANENNQAQTAFRILVSDEPEKLRKNQGNCWDSGKIVSDQSILVPYRGITLQTGKTYFWQVMVWDKDGNPSGWSGISSWQMGLLKPEDWGDAQWVAYDEMDPAKRIFPGIHIPAKNPQYKDVQSGNHVLPLLRLTFQSKMDIQKATIFISGLGQYELSLNGKKVGDGFLTPGWTNYDQYCYYNAYDVTDQVQNGNNAIGVMLGNGFYNVPNERYRKLLIAYGHPKMICRMIIDYEDGSRQVIISDDQWKTAPGPITFSSIYGGEDYDANLEQPGWDAPDFNADTWRNAMEVAAPTGKLVAEQEDPIKAEQVLEVQRVIPLAKNEYLYDFGQNASGIIELKVKGQKGHKIKLIPSELVDEHNHANQNDSGKPYFFTYTLNGKGVETWRPRFSYYGFRYVQVEGAVPDTTASTDDVPHIESLKFLHTRNAAPRLGEFGCSSDLFNRIYTLINWAIKSNFQSVITDCPHREKLGWLEQTYLMGGSIHDNYDVYQVYKKLVNDMIYAQTSDGLIPDIAPEYVVFQEGFRDSPEWGSAGVILPWLLYRWYGDKEIMQKAWSMMTKYVAYLESTSDHHIVTHGLGDWYDLGPKSPGKAQLTPKALTATAIYYYDLHLLTKMAETLGKQDEAQQLRQQANMVKEAFNQRFFDAKANVYATGSQTAMSMPLAVGLVDEQKQDAVLHQLVESIRQSGNALTAGDVGFHFLVKALQDGGQSQLLYEMNSRDDVPGYGYQLKKGATALTESWAALEESSNNHLMLGHIMEWFYSGLAGINQTDGSVGYKEVLIKPTPVGDISWAKGSFNSPYGEIESHWEKHNNSFVLNIQIPVNTTAHISLPATTTSKITVNGKDPNQIEGLEFSGFSEEREDIKVGSGNYRFEVN